MYFSLSVVVVSESYSCDNRFDLKREKRDFGGLRFFYSLSDCQKIIRCENMAEEVQNLWVGGFNPSLYKLLVNSFEKYLVIS